MKLIPRGLLGRETAESIAIPVGAITASLLVFGAFVATQGANPFNVYYDMYRGAFGTWFSLQNTLLRAAPLLLTALCTALPARLGLIVIGGEGAVVMGGLAAASAALAAQAWRAPPLAALAAMFLAGLSAGALWVGLAGALRVYRGVSETISSLLLNYVGVAILNHLVEGALRDPASLNKPSTAPIAAENALGSLPGVEVHWGLAYGVLACALCYVLMHRTTFGFAAAMSGGNVRAALLAGLPVRRLIVLTCMLAGACAGLAGMVEVAAVHGRASASLVSGYGYTGVLVAFIARHHPLAILPVALLLGGIGASGGLVQRTAQLPDATVSVLQGILFLAILASEALRGRLRLTPAPGAPQAAPASAVA